MTSLGRTATSSFNRSNGSRGSPTNTSSTTSGFGGGAVGDGGGGRKRPRASSSATSPTHDPTNHQKNDGSTAAEVDRKPEPSSHGTTPTEQPSVVVPPPRPRHEGTARTAAITTMTTTTTTTETATKPPSTCSVPDCFVPAAVRIRTSQSHDAPHRHQSSSSVESVPLCLLHYYTSDHVRLVPTTGVESIPDVTALQLPDVQRLFANVFVDLQQRLLRAATNNNDDVDACTNDGSGSGLKGRRTRPSTSKVDQDDDDPLAVLHNRHTRNRTTKVAASRKARGNPSRLSKSRPPTEGADKTGGGFLRPESIPERLLQTQFEQAQYHERLQRRLDRAAAAAAASTQETTQKPPPDTIRHTRPPLSLTARRKPSRRSVWNAVLEDADGGPTTASTAATKQGTEPTGGTVPPPEAGVGDEDGALCPSCGRHCGVALGTHANRNDAQRKGETWGNKDRADEAWTRYQCHNCGMVWNEDG